MFKKIIPLAMLVTLYGCALSEMLSMFTPLSGINTDIEVVAGDKAINTEVSGKKETTNNTAEEISQIFNTVNEAEPLLPWMVAMLFLMLPTPTRMGQGIWRLIKSLFRRKKDA